MPLVTNNPDLNQALEKLTHYLALRDHSIFELRQKLLRRFAPEIVEHALAEASHSGILAPDEEIAARAVEMYARQNKSRRYIEDHLSKRGLPMLMIDEESEKEKARALLVKKFRELSPADHGEAFAFLERRGFEELLIEKVLNEKR